MKLKKKFSSVTEEGMGADRSNTRRKLKQVVQIVWKYSEVSVVEARSKSHLPKLFIPELDKTGKH